jgi:transposase
VNTPVEQSSQKAFDRFTHFAGFDWARSSHQIVVVDRAGKRVLNFAFKEDAQGWAGLREKIKEFSTTLAVAVETNCGPAVERLLEMQLTVFPLNPKVAERYRDRKSPAGVKSDERDAFSFADALRTDGHGWRPLRPQDPITAELRMLCRDEISLIEQRTALVNHLQAALHEYYPAAIEAFDDWTMPAAWEFIVRFPTPVELVAAGRKRHQSFLHSHKLYRPQTAPKRLEIFARADQFASPSIAVTNAKSLLAVTLADQLRTLETRLGEYRRRITKLFNDHPDKDCFGSLPGAGEKLAPRLLAELGADRQVFESPDALRCFAGTAPVLRESGKTRFVVLRRSCNKTLRATVHLWADQSRHSCAWAQTYYQEKKSRGVSHAAALRCLGQRWLKILWKMWQERKPYDEARHTRNQVKHGSWVMRLVGSSNLPDGAPTPA